MTQAAPDKITECTICGKAVVDIDIFTSVNMNVGCWYRRDDGQFEEMNGIAKNTTEYFCEACFDRFAQKLEEIYQKKETPSRINK
jgi:hypothetical protein